MLLDRRICGITIVRLALLPAIDYEDVTWMWIYFGLFTTLEFYLGIITACLPALPPVAARIGKTKTFFNIASWSRSSARRLLSRETSKLRQTDPASWHEPNDKDSRTHRPFDGYEYPLLDQSKSDTKVTATQLKPHGYTVPRDQGEGVIVTQDCSV